MWNRFFSISIYKKNELKQCLCNAVKMKKKMKGINVFVVLLSLHDFGKTDEIQNLRGFCLAIASNMMAFVHIIKEIKINTCNSFNFLSH